MQDFVPNGYVPFLAAVERARAVLSEEGLPEALTSVEAAKLSAHYKTHEAAKAARASQKRIEPGSLQAAEETAEIRAIKQKLVDHSERHKKQSSVARAQLQQWLYAGVLPAYCLTEAGYLEAVSRSLWGAKGAAEALATGRTDLLLATGQRVSARVILLEDELARVLAKRPESTVSVDPPSTDNAPLGKRPRKKGGKPRTYDWDAFHIEIIRLVNNNGDGLHNYSPAQLRRIMADWFAARNQYPSETMLKEKIRAIYEAISEDGN